MKLYSASCKEDFKFSFCTGSKNDVGDPHLHLQGERQKPESNLVALETASCFTCRQLIYFLQVLQSCRCFFFLLFLQDEIRLIEWVTKRTSFCQFGHKAPLTSLSVMMLTFSEPCPILCHFTMDLYSPWSYRRNEITDRDSFQGRP